VTLDHIAGVREIIPFLEVKEDAELYGEGVAAVIDAALRNLDDSRRKEGEALAADLQGRLTEVRKRTAEIKDRAPIVVDAYRERLRERVRSLLEGSADFIRRLPILPNDPISPRR
jgi:uncharacterized protein YicC (UPF0701 family)